ncbi:MAG TPA: hypothetical protein VJB87_00070 [Candidatus Nanoarchaeia archaeon]|nr:hypothetical protein [Candidatus Nanoarchaeia archaeon]
MDKKILILVLLLILAILFFSENSSIQKTRQNIWKTSTYIIPNSCYLEGRHFACQNVKIATTGIEFTLTNRINTYSWNKNDNEINTILALIPTCQQPTMIKKLLPEEQQKFVFRNCTVGDVGTQYTSMINISYIEGPESYGITRNIQGILMGEVTY